MSATPLALLRLLSSAAGAAVRGPSPAPAEGGQFQTLLERAQNGELSSGLPVTLADGAGLALTDDQLTRLAHAADRAEAQGASRALVLIDGMALRLDVGVRQVTGAADLKADEVVTGVDAVISVPPSGASPPGEAPTVPMPAPAGVSNQSLLELLARAVSR